MAVDTDMHMDDGSTQQTSDDQSPISMWTPASQSRNMAIYALPFPDPEFAVLYNPTAEPSLFPFPSVEESGMDCDAAAASESHQRVSKSAFDPVHGRVYENRFASDASTASASSGLLQPQQEGPMSHG